MLGFMGAGLFAGAVATGAGLMLAGGLLSPIPYAARAGAFAVVATCAVGMQIAKPRWRFPRVRRQVPEIVFSRGERSSAGQFGFELGLGWRTQLTTLAPQTLALGCVLLGPAPGATAALCLGFAGGRFAHVMIRLLSGGGDAWDDRLGRARWLPPAASVAAISAAGGLVATGGI